MRRAKRSGVAFVPGFIVALVLTLLSLSCRHRPEGQPPVTPSPEQSGSEESKEQPKSATDSTSSPSAWDAAAFQAFDAKGVAPPRTVLTAEIPGEIDTAAILDAIADARAVDPAKFESEESDAATPTGRADVGGEGAEDDGLGMSFEEALPESAELESPGAAMKEEPAGADFSAPPLVLELNDGNVSSEKSVDEDSTSSTPRKLDARLLAPPRLGKILIQNEEGKYESLVPRALRLQTFIEGPRARTIVDYVFSNPHDRALQGTFYYPLPAGASPAAFGMFRATARLGEEEYAQGRLLPPGPAAIPEAVRENELLTTFAPARPSAGELAAEAYLVKDWGELQLAHVVEQKRAREVYEQIVRREIDPALLEWSGGNTFQARVFPIQPLSLKRLVLIYEQTLPVDGEVLRYSYALPEAEELGSIELQLGVSGKHATVQALAGWEEVPEPTATADGWSWYSLEFTAGKDETIDLALSTPQPAAQVLEASSCRKLPGTVFFARMRPPLEPRESSGRTGRALFLVDTSLSREDSGQGLSVELLEKILENDGTIDEYAVLLFDFRARWLHAPSWRPNDAAHRSETLAELGRIYLEGATSFDSTLEELASQAAWLFQAEQPVHAFLMSDGFITWGQDRVNVLLGKHSESATPRWICYQLGSTPFNAALFDALGRESRGRTVTILTREDLESAALAHRTAPVVLKGVRVEGAEARDLVVAGEPGLLFSGQELRIAGRLLPPEGEARLVVDAEEDGQTVTWTVPLAGDGESRLASRAWAELYAQKLLVLDDERLDRMIVALSQRFQLANRVASLLILEREEDYDTFDLKNEAVDLAELEKLRIREEDQRRDRLQGISLDGVPEHAVEVVAYLTERSKTWRSPVPPLPFLDRPLAGGDARMQAEIAYRDARSEDALDVKVYDAVARSRAVTGDTVGALRAYSCLVEKMPANAEAARLAGYACMALGQFEPAAELFERVRLNRPFEPQSYLEEALALEGSGEWGKAARNYELLLVREFPRHGTQARTVAGLHYARLLKGRLSQDDIDAGRRSLLERRLKELSPGGADESYDAIDLQLVIHWNSDSTDVDLWVVEPEGERCFYGHKKTKGGGQLFWDITDGYGPELYQRRHDRGGAYDVLIHYYGNNSARWAVPTSVLLVRDRRPFGPEGEFTRRCRMRLLGAEDAVLELGREGVASATP